MRRSITVAVTLAVAVTTALIGFGGQAAATRRDVDQTIRWQVVAGTFAHQQEAQRLITRLDSMGLKGFAMERDSRAGTIRFEVERPFDRTEAAHREQATLRSDEFKPTLEREAAEDAGR